MNHAIKALSFWTFYLVLLCFAVIVGSADAADAFRHFPRRSTLSALGVLRAGGFEDSEQEQETEKHDNVSRNMYNQHATNWVRTEPRCLSDFTGRPVVFDMLSAELRRDRSGDDSEQVVLDVGCGEGYCARKVVELGAAKVIGNDISQEMINGALLASEGDEKFKYYVSPCCDLLKGLGEHLHYLGIGSAEEFADIAMAVFLFNYMTTFDMEDTISQIFKTLKPGGVFVFSVPHPSMIFCHDENSAFFLNSSGKGYFSSRNSQVLGVISTIDGTKLNIMSVHKTMNDYIQAINKAGFQILDIKEAGVTKEHLAMNPDFFGSVKDRPLHLVFKLKKPLS